MLGLKQSTKISYCTIFKILVQINFSKQFLKAVLVNFQFNKDLHKIYF